jgi:hypothetical protein
MRVLRFAQHAFGKPSSYFMLLVLRQGFGYGDQYYDGKVGVCRARAVRRVAI